MYCMNIRESEGFKAKNSSRWSGRDVELRKNTGKLLEKHVLGVQGSWQWFSLINDVDPECVAR